MSQKETPPEMSEAKPGFPLALIPPKPLANDRLKLISASAANICNRWAATLPRGIAFSAALFPEFWSNHAHKLNIGDTIEVHVDSRDWIGAVYVRDISSSKTRGYVGLITYVEFGAIAQSVEAVSHRVENLGLHQRWGIRRVADGKVAREGLESREAAELALKGIERSTNKVG
jgi:hypothetical protein